MNRKAIYNYLQINGTCDKKTEELIDICYKEVQEVAQFKEIYAIYPYQNNKIEGICLDSKDLELYFEKCHSVMFVACTLGSEIDRKIRYYEIADLHKAYVLNAVAASYLEECADSFEKEVIKEEHTARFCPGYGDLPLSLNSHIASVLQIDTKLGISIQNEIMQPTKSMLGLIGIGDTRDKSCQSCSRLLTCELRKGGFRCYVKD